METIFFFRIRITPNKIFFYREQWNKLQEPPLLTWINFKPNMDKWLHPLYSAGWKYLSIPIWKMVK